MSETDMPTCSVIVRADHTDQQTIEGLLDRLQRQVGVALCEIILVDSSPVGEPLVVRPRDILKVEKLEREQFTYGRSLNVGCAAAIGDYLAILNGHTIPIGTSWLKDITAPFSNPNLAAVCGLQNGTWPNRRNLEQTVLSVANYGPPKWSGLSAANLVVRRTVWAEFPFNETIPYAEDKEWGHRVTKAGWKIMLGAEATIHHAHPERSFRSHLWYVYMTAQSQILYAHTSRADNERARLVDCWIRAPRVGIQTMIKSVRLAQAHFRGIREAKRNRAQSDAGDSASA